MTYPVVLSYVQAEPLLRAHAADEPVASVSPDLGRSTVDVRLNAEGAAFPSGERLRWEDAERIAGSQNVCFVLEDAAAREIRAFSDATGWVRSLYPTGGVPTMLVSGLPMHRIKGIDPWQDTLRKVRTITPMIGRVLDTATGLGYTAIEASKTANEVVTLELDPAGLEIAQLNPWSRELFERPTIRQLVGDAVELLPTLEDASFQRIVHDPPMMSLAGDLYSEAFYRELRRVLARNGRLFHYIGDPASPSGSRTTSGVIRRLQAAGFSRVRRHPEAFGVVAYP